jgi:general secretion pathway protein C
MMDRWATASPGFLDSMDLAKNFAYWRDQSPEQWIALGNRYLPRIAVALLVLLIAFKAADLTWRLLDSRAAPDSVPVAAQTQGPASGPVSGGYEVLTAWEPFGKAPDESVAAITAEQILDAPDTTLNLSLAGTLQASDLPERGSTVIPEKGSAIISFGRSVSDQKVYWTGDTIENAGSTTLHSVFNDRVLLDRGGRLETLRFPENEPTPQSNSRVAARPRPADNFSDDLSSAAQVADAVTQTAALLGQHMSIAMHSENGQMIGFRVQPTGDGQVFAQLGLEPGDILTEVNGTQLNSLRNSSQVIQALGEAAQATVTIRRNGADRAEVLNVGDIQRLAESLQ